jgi:glutamyl-tRNA reductase
MTTARTNDYDADASGEDNAGRDADASREAMPVDADSARERIRTRAEQIRREQTDRALRKLRDRRDLSDRERQVVEELAANLTDELLALPERRLADVDGGDGQDDRDDGHDDLARVAVRIFGED